MATSTKFAGNKLNMKKFITLLMLLLPLMAAAQKTPQEEYIDKYAPLAQQEMLRSGVPASITLAQGILESGAGLSVLAREGNNHFGIKCHKNWKGKTMTMDDDRRGECFRVYDTPEESFIDHSDFLRYRDRYKFLFDLDRLDYKGWAYGLKKAGYATDKKYPEKLIQYIEKYNLTRFDVLSEAEEEALPDSPNQIEEEATVVAPAAQEEFHFSLDRTLYAKNGVPFIYAAEGETYRSIARDYHLFRKELLKYNDLGSEPELLPGTVVYLAAKKKKAPEGLDKYIVEADGEDFHAICQRFAVREKAIMKLNGFTAPVELREGDEINLR